MSKKVRVGQRRWWSNELIRSDQLTFASVNERQGENGEGWWACWYFLFVNSCLTNVHNTQSFIRSKKINSRLDIVKCIIRFRTTKKKKTEKKKIESIWIERSNIIYTYLHSFLLYMCVCLSRRSNERRISLIIFRTTNHYSIHRVENYDLLFFLWKTSRTDIVNMSGQILIDLTFIDITVRHLLLMLLLFKRKPLGNCCWTFTGNGPFFFGIEFCRSEISATTLTW